MIQYLFSSENEKRNITCCPPKEAGRVNRVLFTKAVKKLMVIGGASKIQDDSRRKKSIRTSRGHM